MVHTLKITIPMKHYLIILILWAMAVAPQHLSAQEDPYTRTIAVEDFSRIYIEGGYRVYLYQTSDPYLKIKAPSDSHIDALDVESDSRTLRLSVKRQQLNLGRMELHIGFSQLEELHISGGVKLSTDGFVEVEDLRVRIDGAVNGNIRLKARSVEVISNGGSVIDLAGVTGRLTVEVAGAGHVNARELTAKSVTFSVEGVGFGSVNASDDLDVRIEGVGKVTYSGNPKVKRLVEGLGSVVQY